MITFKKITAADIPTIQSLAKSIWESEFTAFLSPEQIAYMLPMMYDTTVIHKEIAEGVNWELISQNDTPAGYCSYGCSEKGSVKINKIYFNSSLRGSGTLASVIERCKIYAQHHHANRLYLTVNKTNTRAITAYTKQGFTITDAVTFDIGAGYVMDDFIMSLPLYDLPV